MATVATPIERLRFFQDQLGLSSQDLACLEPHAAAFLARRDDFADYFHRILMAIPETRRVVELAEPRGGLRKNWCCWYEGLFTEALSPRFYDTLWISGLKHVERSVDQRFIHLGYCMARLFFSEIIEREVPAADMHRVRTVTDKMVDLCLLVATDAFLAGTTQCDREVINGIAHQVRNPLTVIGGYVRNLQRKVPSESPIQPVLGTMFEETQRLEAMVQDVGAFIDIMQRAPEFGPCRLEKVLENAVRRLGEQGGAAVVELHLGDAVSHPVDSDRALLEEMFYHLLQNSLEAARSADVPIVRVTARVHGEPPAALTIEIFNNGRIPLPEELEHLFSPFFSSKPTGSGFGLPIAALVARKAHGELDLTPLPGEGTRTSVSLPIHQG